MGTPVATSDDLATYLGLTFDTAQTTRATLILGMAQDLCETIISPLPATAKAVVLDVSARAWGNPQGVQAQTPLSVQYGTAPTGGLYLTRANKAALRKLAGSGGAFSIDTLPTGVSEVQSVTITGSPTGGTFTLTFLGQTTTALAYNADTTTVQTALTSLAVVGSGNLTVTGAPGQYTVTFCGALATTPLPLIVGDATKLTGGTTPAVTVATVTQGVAAPGQGLPYWDKDYYGTSGNLPAVLP